MSSREREPALAAAGPLPEPRADSQALRCFVAAARVGTVGGAARSLGRTQPSVSFQLKRLEESWGLRLFRREARGVRLTPEGALLLPRAESALAALADLDEAAGRPAGTRAALRLGTGDALARAVLPPLLAELRAREPGAALEVREGPSSELAEAVVAGEVDLALVSGPARAEGLEEEPLGRSAVVLLLPRGHRLATQRRMPPLAALGSEALVTLPPESAFRRHLAAAFAARGLPFRPAVEVGNLSLVHRFVAAGLGLAPVPAVAFPTTPPGTVRHGPLRSIPPVEYRALRRAGAPAGALERELLHRLRAGGNDRTAPRRKDLP